MRRAAMFLTLTALGFGALTTSGATAASHQAMARVPPSAAFPTWSPDGKQIAFVVRKHRDSLSARYRIVRTSSKPGGKLHTVLSSWGGCCWQMRWGSDGRLLINPASRVKSVRVRGGTPKPKRLFFPGCSSSYGCQTSGFILSSDRDYAVAANEDYSDDNRFLIGLVKLRRGAKPDMLASPLTVEENTGFYDSPLAFSPDGTQLVFRRVALSSPYDTQLAFGRASSYAHEGGPPALMAISLTGGDPAPLADSGIPGASLVPDDAAQVQWSRDGSWVAYIEDDFTTDTHRLQVVPTTGEPAPRALATCGFGSLFSFSWSPNSKLIAYDCEGSGANTSQFVTIRPGGTDATKLLGRNLVYDQRYYPDAYDGGPQWSPDGSRLLFLAWGLYSDVDHVFTVRADGSHLTRFG